MALHAHDVRLNTSAATAQSALADQPLQIAAREAPPKLSVINSDETKQKQGHEARFALTSCDHRCGLRMLCSHGGHPTMLLLWRMATLEVFLISLA